MSALSELMVNQGWMIHDLVDGDQIDNQEERKLLKLTEQAAQELAALRSEIANYETARQEDARRLEQVKGERDAMREALSALLDRLDNHFGGVDKSQDWKEQATARAALVASLDNPKSRLRRLPLPERSRFTWMVGA